MARPSGDLQDMQTSGSLLNLVFRPYWSIVQVKLIVIVSVKDAFKTSGFDVILSFIGHTFFSLSFHLFSVKQTRLL